MLSSLLADQSVSFSNKTGCAGPRILLSKLTCQGPFTRISVSATGKLTRPPAGVIPVAGSPKTIKKLCPASITSGTSVLPSDSLNCGNSLVFPLDSIPQGRSFACNPEGRPDLQPVIPLVGYKIDIHVSKAPVNV